MTSDAHHHIAPTRMDRAFNGAVRWLADRGVNLAGAQTLTIPGRVSGQPRTVPVNPLEYDGREYLIAVRGETDWVRNARVAPTAQLRRGRANRTVALNEVPVAERAPIIAAYLRRWGWEVGRLLPGGLDAKSTVDELAAHAHQFPVFIVVGIRFDPAYPGR